MLQCSSAAQCSAKGDTFVNAKAGPATVAMKNPAMPNARPANILRHPVQIRHILRFRCPSHCTANAATVGPKDPVIISVMSKASHFHPRGCPRNARGTITHAVHAHRYASGKNSVSGLARANLAANGMLWGYWFGTGTT